MANMGDNDGRSNINNLEKGGRDGGGKAVAVLQCITGLYDL